MKAKILLVIIVSLSLSINLFGQTFSFNDVVVNTTSEQYFQQVYLSTANEALISGTDVDAYYNGSTVSLLSNSYNGEDFSVVENNDGMYALSLREHQYLYKWNNTNKTWQYTSVYPPVYSEGSKISVVAPNLSLFISREEDSLKIWKYNDTVFKLIKTFIDPERRFDHGTYFRFYPRENNVVITTYSYTNKNSVFLLYDYDTSIVEISGISSYLGRGCTFNGDDFYFITGENFDSLVRWNAITFEEEFIYTSPSLYYFCYSMFMISTNDIICTGQNGIERYNISSGSMQILSTDHYGGASYCPALQKALFVAFPSTVTEMTITDKVHETEAFESALKLYPIPANNKLTIDFPVLGINDKKIEIYNNLGQLVRVKVFSEFNSEIDVSDLQSGIYLVRLFDQETGKVLGSKKFVKQ